jgi:large conductance mechanosensitive channel
MKDFKAFVLRGNVVDLAVGVVIGAAFGTIVTSLVANVITPLISVLHIPDFSKAEWTFTALDRMVQLRYGLLVNAILSFLVIAAVIFFLVVKPLNRLTGRDKDEEATNKECPHCMSSIPIPAVVCAYCTRDLTPPSRSSAKSKARR